MVNRSQLDLGFGQIVSADSTGLLTIVALGEQLGRPVRSPVGPGDPNDDG